MYVNNKFDTHVHGHAHQFGMFFFASLYPSFYEWVSTRGMLTLVLSCGKSSDPLVRGVSFESCLRDETNPVYNMLLQ